MLPERTRISLQRNQSIGAKRRMQNQIHRLFEIKLGLGGWYRSRSGCGTGVCTVSIDNEFILKRDQTKMKSEILKPPKNSSYSFIKIFVFICSYWLSYSPAACTLLTDETIAIRQNKAETQKHLKFSLI